VPRIARLRSNFDACWEWYGKLSADDQELVATIADVTAAAAEGMAASLPPAPRCPL